MTTRRPTPSSPDPSTVAPARRGRRPTAELVALRARIETLMLGGHRSPAIHRALTGPDSPRPVAVSERQVRAHMRAVEASWRARASDETLERDRVSEIARVEDVMRLALTRATLQADSTIGVGYLNVYLKAEERYARLRGIDAPVRTELSGPGGGPVAFVALADHPAEHLDPREEAHRLHQMAADCEAEAEAADEESRA